MPKILHTADWHLGKTLNGKFDLIEQQREALAQLLAVIDAERPDAVVVAGDVFDHPERPPLAALRTWAWITREIVGRRPGGLPLIAIPGNHDHAERVALNAGIARSGGLYLLHDLDTCDQPLQVAGLEWFGIPFHKPARVRALAATGVDAAGHAAAAGVDADGHGAATGVDAAGHAAAAIGDFDYDAAMAWLARRALARSSHTVPRVALVHAFVEGAGAEGAGEDPVMVGGAGAIRGATLAGFDYVALGHLHGAFAVPQQPHVRYAGSLYPCSFDEGNDKCVTIATWPNGASAGVRPDVRTVPLPVGRKVRVVEERSFAEILDAASRARAAADPGVDDFILARVTDRDPIPHAQARLSEVHPNAQFEQRHLDVRLEDHALVPDPNEHSVEDVFLAFYRHVEGPDADMGELEAAILRDALADGPGDA